MGRDGKLRRLLGNRRLMALIGVGVLTVGVAGFLWFRPDKLFVDDVVDDQIPTATDESPDEEAPSPAEADEREDGELETFPLTVARGDFASHNQYMTSGGAIALELEDGRRIVRFEDFETSNGPDLRVYLSNAEPGEQSRALADDFVDLGPLRGNVGNQNYELPPDTDLERYSTVVVWCVRFTVSFGAAELQAP